MITPILKDDLLKYLIHNAPDMSYTCTLKELAAHFDTGPNVVDAILQQFKKKGLITYLSTDEGTRFIDLEADAHDYILKGGHLGEFEYLERQAEKLERELEKLKSVAPMDTFNNMKGIVDTFLAAASTYKTFNP